jgi:molybdopterin converting factor small subunit
MSVRVTLHGHVAALVGFPAQGKVYTGKTPCTVRELSAALEVAPELVMAVWINHVKQDKDTPVHDGDEVLLISPPSGG